MLGWLKRRLLRWLLGDALIYEVAAVLRGPDWSAPHLKYVFTARVRALLGVDAMVPDVRREREVTLSDVLEAAREARGWYERSRESFNHWFTHMHEALCALRLMERRGGAKAELAELEQLLVGIAFYASGDLNEEGLIEGARKLSICREG